MSGINPCIKNRNADRLSVAASAAINRVRLGQVDHLRRPLLRIRRRNTHAPAVTDAAAITATLGRFLDKVWFCKQDASITEEFVNTMFDVYTIRYSQTINRPRTELIQRVGVKPVL